MVSSDYLNLPINHTLLLYIHLNIKQFLQVTEMISNIEFRAPKFHLNGWLQLQSFEKISKYIL